MPAPPLFDLSQIDLDNIIITRDEIYQHLPHRFEFMQLDGISFMDTTTLTGVGIRDVKLEEWWVRGHIPGRPIFPGVLMIETAAQLAAYFTYKVSPTDKFLGFGGLENVKFRQAVTPPSRMYFLLKGIEVRPRRTICDVQAYVNNQMAFEGRIIGMPV